MSSIPTGHRVLLGHGINMAKRTQRVPVYLYDEHRKRGTFVFGTTGVGKTFLESIMVNDDIKSGKSCIVFDPKADQRLFSSIYDQAKKCGRLDELMLITPIYPQYSVAIDPMAYYYDPEELVTHTVSGIQTRDEFYGAASRLFVTPIIYGKLIIAKAEGRMPTITLHDVYQSLDRESQTMLLAALRTLPDDFAEQEDVSLYATMLQSNLNKPADYYEKIITTLHANLVPLIAGNIGKIIGKADSNKLIQRIEEGKRVICVVHTGTMVSPSSAAILGRVLLSMIMATIGRHYISSKERMEPALTLHIDEAPTIVTPETNNILAMAGSANVMTHLYAQSASQIYAALGDENLGRSALDNTNNKIFMKCSDAVTADYVVEHFGTKKVLSGVFANNQVTTRQVDEDVLKATDLLDLQRQEAYMMSYTGRWAFVTETAPEPGTKIIFPDAPATLLSQRDQRNIATGGGPVQ